MEKTDIYFDENLRRSIFFAIAIGITIALGSGGFLFYSVNRANHKVRLEARKGAFARADKMVLFNDIEHLEDYRHHSIADLVLETKYQTNLNAALVCLLAESHMAFSVAVSNFAGTNAFVDPWGLPYKVTLVGNPKSSGEFGHHVEKRVTIQSSREYQPSDSNNEPHTPTKALQNFTRQP